MDNKLDRETVTGFQQGSPRAFRLVHRAYYAMITTFAYRLVKNVAEAQDITTEAFLGLYNKHSEINCEEHIRNFLFKSARNRALNYLDAQKRLEVKLKEFTRRMKNDALLNNESINAELIAAICMAIEDLPGECKKIFKLLFYDELTPAEIANILQIDVSTVYVQKGIALKKLRIAIGKGGL